MWGRIGDEGGRDCWLWKSTVQGKRNVTSGSFSLYSLSTVAATPESLVRVAMAAELQVGWWDVAHDVSSQRYYRSIFRYSSYPMDNPSGSD